MRAVVFDRFGPPGVLRIAELPVPEPAAGRVRVHVRAAGVQPFDTKVRRGETDVTVRFPQRLGSEFSGVIDQVGPEVEDWARGAHVLGWAPMTALADYVVVRAGSIVAKPDPMPWDVAGSIGASGQAALTVLRELRVGRDDTLLVHAAAGAVGSTAVQLARHGGARVIGTASPASHGYLTDLGAIPVAYGPGLVDRVRNIAPDGIDAVLDAVGGPALSDSLELGADRSRIATLVDHTRAEELGVLGVHARRSTDLLSELVTRHQQGELRVAIRARLGLDQIAEAHRLVESGHGVGKVVILVDDDPPRTTNE